jgi:hypothetical protein
VARSAIANAAAMEYESLDVNARACRVNRSELGCIESFTVRQNFDAVGVLDFRIDEERNEAREIATRARVPRRRRDTVIPARRVRAEAVR